MKFSDFSGLQLFKVYSSVLHNSGNTANYIVINIYTYIMRPIVVAISVQKYCQTMEKINVAKHRTYDTWDYVNKNKCR